MQRYLIFIVVLVLVLAPYIVGAHSTETAQLTTASTVQKVVVPKIKINTEISDQNTSVSTDSVLKPGAVAKQEVVLLQAFLYNQRIYNGSIDGVYGPKTKEAVKAFQSTTNGQLTADGVAGPRTMSYIESLSKGEAVVTTGTNTNNVSGSTNKISIPSLPKNVLTRALKPQSGLVLDTSTAAKKITSKPKSNFSVFSNVGIYNVAASGAQSGTNGSNFNTNFSSPISTVNTKYVCGVKDGVNQCYLLSLDEVAQIDSGTLDLEGVLAARAGGTTQVGNCPSVYVDENGNTSVTDQSWWNRTNACGGASSNNQSQIAATLSDEVCLEGKVVNLKTAKATGALCPNGLSFNEEDSNKYLGVIKPQETDRSLVKEVQKALVTLNYAVSADGVFGTQTKNEIIDFQKDKNLTPDGVIGRATFEALQKELDKKSSNVSLLNNVINIRNTAYEQENQSFITTVIKKQFDINKPKTWGQAVIDSPTSQWYVKNYGTDSRGKPRSFVVHTHTMPESASVTSTSNNSFSDTLSSAFQSLAQVGSSQVAQASQALTPTDGGVGTASDIGQVYCKRITSTKVSPTLSSVRVIIGTDKIFWVKDVTPTLKYQIPNIAGPYPTMKILDGAGKSGLYFSYVQKDNDGIPANAIPSVLIDENINLSLEILNKDKIFTLSPDGKKYYSFDWSKLNDPNLPKCTMPSYGNGFIGVIGPDGTVKSVNGSTGVNPGGIILPKQCSDGIDNDADGKTDYPVDPGCSSSSDDSENSNGGGGSGTPPVSDGTCSDGIKNGNEDSVDTGGSCEGGILSPGTNHQQPVIDHVPGSGKPVLVNWQNVSVPASWEEYLIQTKKDWNLARKLKISLGGPGYTVPIHYRDDFKDDDGVSPAQWIGAAWWYPASGGHQYQTEVGFNKKKMDELNLNTPDYIQFLVCHELGHSIGMGHADVNNYNMNLGTCSDYSRAPGGGTHSFPSHPNTNFGTLDNLHPSSIDIAAINSLYQHTH